MITAMVLVAPSVNYCPDKAIGPFISTSKMSAERSIGLPFHINLTKSLVADLLAFNYCYYLMPSVTLLLTTELYRSNTEGQTPKCCRLKLSRGCFILCNANYISYITDSDDVTGLSPLAMH